MNELKLRLSKPTFDKYVLNPIFYVNYVFSIIKENDCVCQKKKNDVIIFSDVVTFLHIARAINEKRLLFNTSSGFFDHITDDVTIRLQT